MSDETVETPAPAVAPEAPTETPPAQPTETAEAKPPEKPPEPPRPDPAKSKAEREAAQRFAALARREKEVSAKRAALAAEQERISKAEQEAKALQERWNKAKLDPEGTLNALYGADWYEKLTELKLNGGKPTPDLQAQALREEMDARFKAEEAARAKAEEARIAAAEAEKAALAKQREEQIALWRSRTVDFVKSAGEQYELTNLFGSADEVPALIELYHQQTGKILSEKEAAELVEKHFEEQLEKALQSKKGRAKVPAPAIAPTVPSAQPRTITNGFTASTPSAAPPPNSGPLSQEERFKRAMAAMEAAAARGRAQGA